MGILKKLTWFFKRAWRPYVLGVLCLGAVSMMSVAMPKIIGNIIDAIAAQQLTADYLYYWLAVMAVIAVLQYILRFIWRTKIFGAARQLEQLLRERLFHHFLQMDRPFFQKYRTGDLMAHATNDLNAVRQVAGPGILMMADALFVGITTLLTMFFTIDWRLTLVALVPMPLMIVIARVLGSRIHARFRKAQEAFSALNDKTQESITGVKVIKTFGEEAADVADFERQTAVVSEKNLAVARVDGVFAASIQLVIGLSYALTIFFGGFMVSGGSLTIGELVAFLSYISMMTWPLFAVGQLFNVLERGSASYSRIEELLREKSHVVISQHPVTTPLRGDLHIDVAQFTYPEAPQAALSDIHIQLRQGQTLGVVGKTGSGKSTLFKLLLREFDTYKGRITYGNVGLKHFDLDTLLSDIGYVPQEHFLFSTTVRENISFVNPELPDELVVSAAQAADVHNDIIGFTEGYDTLVGERGVSLSGGQKQRIAIARALIMDPELLILDDSLSAVDAKTEERILSSLKAQRANKTTIIAAHRLSSIQHADEIIVLDEGRIVARGTHEQLLAQGGWYAEMYQRQQLEQAVEGGVQ